MPAPLVRDRDVEELAVALQTGRMIAMLGAGCSARAGYPLWSTLLTELHDAAERKIPPKVKESLKTHPDMLWRADFYRQTLGEQEFRQFLARRFAPLPWNGPIDSSLRHLTCLPFSHVLTTNYDPSIEQAHREAHRSEPEWLDWTVPENADEFINHVVNGSGRKYVYVHGHYSEPGRIILTESDYAKQYVASENASRKLFALLAMHRFVFIGFSLDDPDLMAIVREVNVRISGGRRHFAILGLTGDGVREVNRLRFLERFGVKAIFYEEANNHAALADLIHDLLARCQPQTAAPGASPAVRAARLQKIPRPATRDPEDPQKHWWGGSPEWGGWRLDGTVRPVGGSWFEVRLEIKNVSGFTQPAGTVQFHLHQTFRAPEAITMADGHADLTLRAYGAFTVGAEIREENGARTELELDLAELEGEGALREFRER